MIEDLASRDLTSQYILLKESDYESERTLYWLSLLILSSGYLLYFHVNQSELKYWDVMSILTLSMPKILRLFLKRDHFNGQFPIVEFN